jgi:hypothetical protein
VKVEAVNKHTFPNTHAKYEKETLSLFFAMSILSFCVQPIIFHMDQKPHSLVLSMRNVKLFPILHITMQITNTRNYKHTLITYSALYIV